MNAHHRRDDRRRPLVDTERLAHERGSSLIIALVFILVVGLLVSVLSSFAFTNLAATKAYRLERAQRYAGDAALNTGINYFRNQRTMGRDPSYADSDPDCHQEITTDPKVGAVSVTCEAVPGSNSGEPEEQGKVPTRAIQVLGERQSETPPWNGSVCEQNPNPLAFTNRGSTSPSYEPSIWFRAAEMKTWDEVADDWYDVFVTPGCTNRQRDNTSFIVKGSVTGAGNAEVTGGTLKMEDYYDQSGTLQTSQLRVRNCNAVVGAKISDGSCIATTDEDRIDPGTDDRDDPSNPGHPVKDQWVPVTPNWTVRTKAYQWNGSGLDEVTTCANRGIYILLPGWYKDADVLNQFTNKCTEVTVWLAPDPGTDGIPLTSDDKTGAFYFDFTENATSNVTCSKYSTSAAQAKRRWCIGGFDPSANVRVVTGWPNGWNPLGFTTGVPARTVVMNRANAVDGFLTFTWSNPNGARVIGDGSVASYTATGPPILCSLFSICLATTRDIRVRDFSPKVTGAADDSKIYVTVAHRELSASLVNPTFTIRTVSPDSGTTTNCPDTYYVDRNDGAMATVPLKKLGPGDQVEAAALSIGTCLNSADLINGAQITMQVTGDGRSGANQKKVELDGFQMRFISTPGAIFPLSADANDPTVGPAKSDCDDTKPGTQLIFGGESHVYIPDGSLEVCAGPYPTSPGDHQQIGIYGVPSVPPLETVDLETTSGTLVDEEQGYDIAEEEGRRHATIEDGLSWSCPPTVIDLGIFGSITLPGRWCGVRTFQYEAETTADVEGYDIPSGLALDTLTVRATYNPKNLRSSANESECNTWAGLNGFFDFIGQIFSGNSNSTTNLNCEGPRLRVGTCTYSPPLSTGMRSWATDVNLNTCGVTQAQVENGTVPVTWVSRSKLISACVGGCVNWNWQKRDELDGIEFLLGLKMANPSTAPTLVPQKGCIVAYPNRFEGAGTPDCSLIKAESVDPKAAELTLFGITFQLNEVEGRWLGRWSVKGTVYAPSAAIDIDEVDAAAPTASRGIVADHLRIKGYQRRAGFANPAVSIELDDQPQPRQVVVVSCIRADGRESVTTPCDAGAGDKILTRARVNYQDPRSRDAATVPTQVEIKWWTDDR